MECQNTVANSKIKLLCENDAIHFNTLNAFIDSLFFNELLNHTFLTFFMYIAILLPFLSPLWSIFYRHMFHPFLGTFHKSIFLIHIIMS